MNYPETLLASLIINGEKWEILWRDFCGLRVRHSQFVEWPILMPLGPEKGKVVWNSYEFNGERSSGGVIPDGIELIVGWILNRSKPWEGVRE